MKIGHIVDAIGNFVEDVLEGFRSDYPEGYQFIQEICPDGFYKPCWSFDNEVWYEGLPDSEIQAIKNAPKPLSDSEKIEQVKADTSLLDDRTIGMQSIDDYTLNMTVSLEDRSQGMQDIDDYALSLIFEQSALIESHRVEIEALKARILILEGGA